jgi:hypothetical protein
MQPIDVLIGEWTIEVLRPDTSPDPIQGRLRFEPILDGRFVVQHWTIDHPDFPDAMAVLGPDTYHYFDTRGVARIYHASLDGGVWRLWREDPDFWQRFTGTISADGNIIRGAWEMSHDRGTNWRHDFAMTYVKAQPA